MKLKIAVIIMMSCFARQIVISQPLKTKPALSIIRKDSSSVYLVNYAGTKIGKVTVTIKDSNGNIVVTKYIKDERDFSLPVNFTSMGQYTVQVDDGISKVVQTVNYNNNTGPTYSHVTNLGNKSFLFQASHIGSEKITIRIYDGAGIVVFDQEESIKGDFAMLFNLKNIMGTPVFEVNENSGNSLVIPGNPTEVVVKK